MIILIVAALVILAVRLVVTCVAAVVAIRMSLDGGAGVPSAARGLRTLPRSAPGIPSGGRRMPRAHRTPGRSDGSAATGRACPAEPAPNRGSPTRWMAWLIVVRDPSSGMPVPAPTRRVAAGRTTVLDGPPRPTTGPAYLGGRDDAAYLRGWDDGVDWIREGNPERAPSWSSAAYMTGWNDSIRAMAKARCGRLPAAA